ncbi:unnamed protein product [Leuciscus chuanchicus]
MLIGTSRKSNSVKEQYAQAKADTETTPDVLEDVRDERRISNFSTLVSNLKEMEENGIVYGDEEKPGLPPCLGHDLFDGVVSVDLAMYIKHLVTVGKHFTYGQLNQTISQFTYLGSDANNKPCDTLIELEEYRLEVGIIEIPRCNKCPFLLIHSSPEPLSVASSSTCPISSISPISAWVNSFEVPRNKVRLTLRRAVDAGERPAPDDRRHLMRVTVDAMREHSLNPTCRECVVVAKDITKKYPNSFLDKNEEGELIGCGYFSIINQIKIRDGDDQPAVATCARIDSYGCVRWQPEDYPDGETSASLKEKKLEMLDIFSREGLKGPQRERVEDLMAITYAKQREYINTKPSPRILDVGKEWPFLFSQKFLLSHFTTLTNVELYTRLNEDMDKKGKRLLDFFSSQITRWRKEVKADLKEALKKDREGTDGLAAMLVMLAHFKDQEESLFLIADV